MSSSQRRAQLQQLKYQVHCTWSSELITLSESSIVSQENCKALPLSALQCVVSTQVLCCYAIRTDSSWIWKAANTLLAMCLLAAVGSAGLGLLVNKVSIMCCAMQMHHPADTLHALAAFER